MKYNAWKNRIKSLVIRSGLPSVESCDSYGCYHHNRQDTFPPIVVFKNILIQTQRRFLKCYLTASAGGGDM